MTLLPMGRAVCGYIALCCLMAGCAQFDFEASDSQTKESGGLAAETEPVTPTGWGSGTQSAPYTPDNLLLVSDTGTVWVMGYVVGSTPQHISNAKFSAESPSKGNILISSDRYCSSISDCIPVELSSTRMQKALSLFYHPEYYQRCVVVCGTPATYHNMEGLRKTTAGYCLPTFDLSSLIQPTTGNSEWDYQEFLY